MSRSLLLYGAAVAYIGLLFCVAWRLVPILTNRDESLPPSIHLALSLLLTEFLCSGTGLLGSIFRANGVTFYAAVAVAAVAALRLLPAPQRHNPGRPSWPWIAVAACVAVLFVPLVIQSIVPISDTDSLYTFDYLLPWMHNLTQPLGLPPLWGGYPAAWEASLVPGLSIAHATDITVVMAALPIGASVVGIYALAVDLGMPAWGALIVAGDAAAVRSFWAGASGLQTVKTDMMVCAGVVLLALALVGALRRWPAGRVYAVAVLGAAAALIKYNGMEVLVLSTVGTAIVAAYLWRHWRLRFASGRWLSWGSGILGGYVLLDVGIYYLRNLIDYRNPFYPVEVTVGGRTILPGTLEPVGTSILAHIHDPAMWHAILPGYSAAYGGPLFTVLFFLGVGAPALAVVALLFRRWALAGILGFSGLAWWVMYITAPLVVGIDKTDTSGLWQLISLRFAEGPLALLGVCLAACLLALRVPRWLAALPAAFSLGWRMRYLMHLSPDGFGHLVRMSIWPAAVVLALALAWMMIQHHQWLSWRVFAVALAGMFAVTSIPQAFSSNARREWGVQVWGTAPMKLFNAPAGTSVAFVIDGSQSIDWFLLAAGSGLENEVIAVNPPIHPVGTNPYDGMATDGATYLVRFGDYGSAVSEKADVQLAAALPSLGYTPLVVTPYVVLGIKEGTG